MSEQSPALPVEQQAAAERLLVDYARLVDDREAERWADLFGSNGALVLGEREISGKERLTKFATRSVRGVHVQGVASFTSQPDGTVASTSSFVFVNVETAAVIAGWYRDVLTPDGTGYVFARRQIDIRTSS